MEVEKKTLAEGRNGQNQYHESTGIWNGAQGQFRSSISAADCVSHPGGKASEGFLTTALNKSIVLHFVCMCVCVSVYACVWLCVLSAQKPSIHWQREPGEVLGEKIVQTRGLLWEQGGK